MCGRMVQLGCPMHRFRVNGSIEGRPACVDVNEIIIVTLLPLEPVLSFKRKLEIRIKKMQLNN